MLRSGGQLNHAGRQYYVIPFEAGAHCFHPKIHYFTGAKLAVVGSGNLTPSGCGGNIEIADIADHTDPMILSGVADFFSQLLNAEQSRIPDDTRKLLLKHLPKPPQAETGTSWFLHSLNSQSLYDQLKEIVGSNSFPNLLLAAPFHHPCHETSNRLSSIFKSKNILVAAGSEVPSLPNDEMTTGHFNDCGSRPLHAKLIHAVNDDSILSVVGSANLTNAAWKGQNVEAVTVRLFPNKGGTLSNTPEWDPIESFEKTEWTKFGMQFPGNRPKTNLHAPHFEASLTGGKLIIEFPKDCSTPQAIHIICGEDHTAVICSPHTDNNWIGR